jgi:F-type H+-transporting ATPase subunit k
MGVLGSTFAGAYLALSGGDKKKAEQGPPVNAASKDEEKFIQYVILFLT